jgi:DNA/RNA endonuclease YhcR with UshA esterase domain
MNFIACLAALILLVLPPTALRAQMEVNLDAIVQVEASDREKLMTMEGQIATVTGELTAVGATDSGSITFLNFSKGTDGFVAIVKKRELSMFPDGFDDLKGKRISVTGTILIYRDATPQIELSSPSQIEVVGAADSE